MVELDQETVVAETSDATPSPEATTDEPTKDAPEVKTDEKTGSAVEEELLEGIETLEGDERGKFALTVGDSTYYGQTKKEVFQNLVKGKTEQDSYIRKMKAEQKVKVPDEYKEGKKEESPMVELPNERDIYIKHLDAVARRNGVDVGMLNFGRDDWNKYQDEHGLRDHEIGDLKLGVREVLRQAGDLTARDMEVANVGFINKNIIEEETQAVRDMLADAGLDVDKFDADAMFEAALKKRNSNGVILSGAITAEANKQIVRLLRQSTPVKKDLAKDIEKGREAKAAIKSPPVGTKVIQEDNRIFSYDELARQAKNAIHRAGREI